MSPSWIREKVVADKTGVIRSMVEGLRALPRGSLEEFLSDPRTAAAAESYLRRALEALLDLGRHILAKGFATAVVEYKEIPAPLQERGILTGEEATLMRQMAGYRNRMVHFYDEVSREELHEICSSRLEDFERLLASVLRWIEARPEMLDKS